MFRKLSFSLLVSLVLACLPAAAEEDRGAERSAFILIPNVRIWGADMTVGYRGLRLLPAVDTVFWAHVGGGWEGHGLYRDFSTSPILGAPTAAGDPGAAYDKLTFDWQVGLSQGILYSDRLGRNLLEAVLLAKWRLDRHYEKAGGTSSLISDSSLPDSNGAFVTSFLLALRVDGVATSNLRQTKDGVYAEVSAEWAPVGLFGSTADYVRLNGHLSGLVTLAQSKHVALVAGDRLEGDLLLAPGGELANLPVWARTTLGGMNPDLFNGEKGLGGAVRGVNDERFDGTLKLVNNLELRVLFPEILPVAIFPGLIVFVDAGLVDQGLDRQFVLPRDFLLSTGAGLYLRALVADLVLYGSYCLTPEEARGFMLSFFFRTQF